MKEKRRLVKKMLFSVIDDLMDEKVLEFKARNKLELSLFDFRREIKVDKSEEYTGHLDDFYCIDRYRLVEFGSTMLGVDSSDSDLDLLLTTFDCLFDRTVFFNKFEAKLRQIYKVSEFIIIKNASVPVAKFEVQGVKIDLVFADFDTPREFFTEAQ